MPPSQRCQIWEMDKKQVKAQLDQEGIDYSDDETLDEMRSRLLEKHPKEKSTVLGSFATMRKAELLSEALRRGLQVSDKDLKGSIMLKLRQDIKREMQEDASQTPLLPQRRAAKAPPAAAAGQPKVKVEPQEKASSSQRPRPSPPIDVKEEEEETPYLSWEHLAPQFDPTRQSVEEFIEELREWQARHQEEPVPMVCSIASTPSASRSTN